MLLPFQVSAWTNFYATLFYHTHYWHEVGICVYVCMVITYNNSKDQPGKVANPARGQVSLSPFTPENLVSRDAFGSRPVPRQPAHLHTQAESDAYLRDSSRFSWRRPFNYSNCHTSSGQSRAYRVTHLRTDGVYCREFAGIGPVNLKVVPVTGAAFASPWTNKYAPLFPTPTIGMKWLY